MPPRTPTDAQLQSADRRRKLAKELKAHPPNEAAAILESMPVAIAFDALIDLNPSFTQDILAELPVGRRAEIVNCAAPALARQWDLNKKFDKGTIGRLMEPPYAVFRPGMTVEQAIEELRSLIKTASSIFLTTATDIVSMGMLLGLATLLVR